MKNDEVLLVFSVDIYFDQVDLNNTKRTIENLNLLPDISDIIYNEFSSFMPKITWLVSDDRIIIKKFKESNNIIRKNDEVGLHSLVSRNQNFSKMTDTDIEKYFDNSFDMLKENEIFPKSTRIAGCAGNNKLFSYLERKGIQVDSSAIPNRKRDTEVKFDWSKTTNKPYFPSKLDYQITENDQEKCHKILEVPLTTIPTRMPYDKNPVFRYLDPGYKKEIFSNELDEIIQKESTLITIIHPMELIRKGHTHPLYSNSLENFKLNLTSIIEISKKHDKKIKCMNLVDMYNFPKHN